MAAAHVHVEESTVNLVPSEVKLYDLKCHSCLYLKEDLQASVNEIKSMAEIIKILKNELHRKVCRCWIMYKKTKVK